MLKFVLVGNVLIVGYTMLHRHGCVLCAYDLPVTSHSPQHQPHQKIQIVKMMYITCTLDSIKSNLRASASLMNTSG